MYELSCLVQEQSGVLRRTKTISAGQRLRLDSVGARSSTSRIRSYIAPSQTPAGVDNWFASTRRVQIVSPSASPGAGPATGSSTTSSIGHLQDSSADSQPTGVELDPVTVPGSTSPALGLLERRTQLKRNAYPLRYVKRAVPQQPQQQQQQQSQQQMNQNYANGPSSSSQRWYISNMPETAEVSDLQNINAQ